MIQKEKRKYMKYAMNLIGINVNDKYAAILVEVYEEILRYKGNINLKQISAIETQMEYEYKRQKDEQSNP